VTCLACSRACPTGAIILVDGKDDRKEPSIDPERCTGCGACEYVCPVRSISAVQVEGNLVHRRI
jgi:formate hydrogenlyase subunit 6/NADH:ubiquinone oxidoreductase subunit I